MGSANAGPKADSETAKELAEQGFDAYDEGDYEEAIVLFEEANDIAPVTGLLFNIAQSYRQLGERGCADALEYYQRFRASVIDEGERPPKRLKTLISEMKACVEERTDEEGDPAEADLSVPEPATESDDDRLQTDATTAPTWRRPAGWGLVGLGVASIAVSTATGLIANGRRLDLEDVCNEGVCAPSLSDEIGSYNRMRTAAITTGVVGVAAVVAGSWLLLRSPGKESNAGAAIAERSVEPWIGVRSAGVRCTF